MDHFQIYIFIAGPELWTWISNLPLDTSTWVSPRYLGVNRTKLSSYFCLLSVHLLLNLKFQSLRPLWLDLHYGNLWSSLSFFFFLSTAYPINTSQFTSHFWTSVSSSSLFYWPNLCFFHLLPVCDEFLTDLLSGYLDSQSSVSGSYCQWVSHTPGKFVENTDSWTLLDSVGL